MYEGFLNEHVFVGTRAMFCLIALVTLIVLGANFAVNRKYAYEGNIKYGAFDEDDAGALGKHGTHARATAVAWFSTPRHTDAPR